jgi:hypothetical protein
MVEERGFKKLRHVDPGFFRARAKRMAVTGFAVLIVSLLATILMGRLRNRQAEQEHPELQNGPRGRVPF